MASYAEITSSETGGILGEPSTATPPPLTMRQRIHTWDKNVSRKVYDASYTRIRALLLFLELTGHGVPWVLVPALVYAIAPHLGAGAAGMLLNYLGVAVLDLLVIAIVKPAVGRKRPDHNGGMTAITIHAIDQYSFPSGHATRAGLNTAFVAYIQAVHPESLGRVWRSWFVLALVIIWAIAVAASRVALGRHHVIDVAAGLVMGILYVLAWHFVWIPDSMADTFRRHLRHVFFAAAL